MDYDLVSVLTGNVGGQEVRTVHADKGGERGQALENECDADSGAGSLQRRRQAEEKLVVLVTLPVARVVKSALNGNLVRLAVRRR